MPIFSITRMEARLPGVVKATISCNPSLRESVLETGPRALACESLIPVRAGEPPANLDRWCKVRLERDVEESDVADEPPFEFGGEESPAVMGEVSLDAFEAGLGLLPGQRRWKVAHHFRISVDGGEGIEILRLPGAKQQPVCSDHEAANLGVRYHFNTPAGWARTVYTSTHKSAPFLKSIDRLGWPRRKADSALNNGSWPTKRTLSSDE